MSAPSPQPVIAPPPVVAPYHPPPAYPPPPVSAGTDSRAVASVAFAILGLIFGLPLGLPGMIAGPIAYFLGKGARARIAESGGTLGGASAANAGRILGIVTTAVGALVTLLWFIVILNAFNDVSFGQ
ncbi:MAG TPA: hypothetical protein VGV88_14195 [Candidatus Dormibacteraeota bacterium]|nr:hypothetical protein [Candidatus Dormibacteraeota bacterium]